MLETEGYLKLAESNFRLAETHLKDTEQQLRDLRDRLRECIELVCRLPGGELLLHAHQDMPALVSQPAREREPALGKS
jgi:hypothetical protein